MGGGILLVLGRLGFGFLEQGFVGFEIVGGDWNWELGVLGLGYWGIEGYVGLVGL